MKRSILTLLCIFSALQAQAQYGDGGYGNGAGRGERAGRYIESDAIENQAIQKLESATQKLKSEILANNNYDYGTAGGRGRGSAYSNVDLLSICNNIEFSSQLIRQYVRGAGNARNQASLQNELNNLNHQAYGLLNSIPSLSRRSADLIDDIYAVTKAVGAVEIVADAPRATGPVVVNQPPMSLVRDSFCSLSFSNTNYETFAASGYGIGISQANASLFDNCSKISGYAGYVSNAAACQSKISAAKCVNAADVARGITGAFTRFTTCSVTFSNTNYETFTTNGAGENLVAALGSLWDSCRAINGYAGYVSNFEACRRAIADQKFSCSVH